MKYGISYVLKDGSVRAECKYLGFPLLFDTREEAEAEKNKRYWRPETLRSLCPRVIPARLAQKLVEQAVELYSRKPYAELLPRLEHSRMLEINARRKRLGMRKKKIKYRRIS